MAIDVEALLAPVSEDQPCGSDLSLDLATREIERLIASGTAVEFDSNTGKPKPLPEVDWNLVIRGIVEQFAKTKDISLAVYLCRAGALSKQLDVVAHGAAVLNGLIERYWDQAHPLPEDASFLGRSTSCDALGHRGLFINPLERIPIVVHPRLGIFSGADLFRLRKNAAAESDFGLFRQALNELGDASLKTADTLLGETEDALRRAAASFAEKAGGGASLNFKPAQTAIAELRKTIGSFFMAPVADAQPESVEGAAGAAQPDAPRGAPNSREDILRALDAVADYYRRREPSSPVLPLIERAKSWVPMTFLDVLDDIAPESLAAAKLVLSKRPHS